MSKNPVDLIFRSPVKEDAQAVLDLMIACDIADYGEADSELADLLDDWSEMDLQQDTWLVFNNENVLLGYAGIYVDAGGVFHYDLYVHPGPAYLDVNRQLIEKGEARTRAILSEKNLEKVDASLIMADTNQGLKTLAEKLGYRVHIYHCGMRITFDSPPAAPQWVKGITLRTAIPGEDDHLIYEFIQHTFEKPGRTAPSFEGWSNTMLGASNFRSDLWFLAFHEKELVGANLCFAYPEYGWVRQLGVEPAWRGKGIGAALLQHAFCVFYEMGYTSAGLGVEAENLNAFHLYERVGMQCTKRYVDYRRQITVS